ncbi:GSCFA domain-containing protein [Seohaeicola nanhaiensis]|uniref:GSCFA domain-containing protein n=1 Tax=Seohaeicola nanhaiensis TaxID=1387282 RepID=A0ABV9KAT5_9RHOB
MTDNPYQSLAPEAFWKSAVASRNMFDISGLHQPRFNLLPRHKVAAYGSCFAQHFGRALAARGYSWLRTETAPERLSEANAKRFNYDIFSSRTGNIYTTSLLLQWMNWAAGKEEIPEEIWEKDGRFYDPFRPRIEPDGFESVEELRASQRHTVQCFGDSIREADVFVFTLGLTESWKNAKAGYEYPMCPGTVAGTFDPEAHQFENQAFPDIQRNLRSAIRLAREMNPGLKIILTVSPVPLTATMSGKHVLVASSGSKSILRAVADLVESTMKDVAYFPSYEIINSPVFRGTFFEPNQREVNARGVSLVMDHFFEGMFAKFGKPKVLERREKSKAASDEDLVCEEALLGAFG